MTASVVAPHGAAAFPFTAHPVLYSSGRLFLFWNFFLFFVFSVCIFADPCYITHHSLRIRDEVLKVRFNKN